MIATADVEDITKVSDEQISAELAKFVGQIKQRPSSVSAIKIDGKSAHARVRAGESVDIPMRDITIYEMKINKIHNQKTAIEIDIAVVCSAGDGVRTWCARPRDQPRPAARD